MLSSREEVDGLDLHIIVLASGPGILGIGCQAGQRNGLGHVGSERVHVF